jgi:hypothetical protein
MAARLGWLTFVDFFILLRIQGTTAH